MKVELTKEDWKMGLAGATDLYKNALVQIEVYKNQIEVCEAKIAEFPEDKKEEKKVPKGVG